ncbi:hypothetical protein HAPS_0394 [Glaesserella parasuis SH0165]|uniref:Uncharacterized protein n=1 Tax=Glaesserella parasuis serovar 5 (strain SH0165) TaxID=557723 RepID=B8F421_GLAP5|nr:hypothetical protein HAPS_0394 [Glaesserella parasuis SH0165]
MFWTLFFSLLQAGRVVKYFAKSHRFCDVKSKKPAIWQVLDIITLSTLYLVQ